MRERAGSQPWPRGGDSVDGGAGLGDKKTLVLDILTLRCEPGTQVEMSSNSCTYFVKGVILKIFNSF